MPQPRITPSRAKVDVFRLFLALLVLGAGAGCSGDDLPLCVDVSWSPIRELTGTPSFTASQIASGDPLAIAIPVDEYTRSVSVWIRLENDPDAGPRPSITLTAETTGAEIVQLPLEDTDLAPGVYFAATILLDGDISADVRSDYTSGQGGVPYILSWQSHFELPPYRCLTDILAPTFEVVD